MPIRVKASLAITLNNLLKTAKELQGENKAGRITEEQLMDYVRGINSVTLPYDDPSFKDLQETAAWALERFRNGQQFSLERLTYGIPFVIKNYQKHLIAKIQRHQGIYIPKRGDRKTFDVKINDETRPVEFEFSDGVPGEKYYSWRSVEQVALGKFPTGDKVWPTSIGIIQDQKTGKVDNNLTLYRLNSNRGRVIAWNDPKWVQFYSQHGKGKRTIKVDRTSVDLQVAISHEWQEEGQLLGQFGGNPTAANFLKIIDIQTRYNSLVNDLAEVDNQKYQEIIRKDHDVNDRRYRELLQTAAYIPVIVQAKGADWYKRECAKHGLDGDRLLTTWKKRRHGQYS